MTTEDDAESFGPYSFVLSPAEREAAAARYGWRGALRGSLIASHGAPLAAFVLILLFASILGLTGLISRRGSELTILFTAAAFMIQRFASHWLLIRRARNFRRTAMASLDADGALTARVDAGGVSLVGGGRSRRLDYVDCQEAEEVAGLVYLWPRHGVPVVVPTGALGEGESVRLLAQIKRRIAEKRDY